MHGYYRRTELKIDETILFGYNLLVQSAVDGDLAFDCDFLRVRIELESSSTGFSATKDFDEQFVATFRVKSVLKKSFHLKDKLISSLLFYRKGISQKTQKSQFPSLHWTKTTEILRSFTLRPSTSSSRIPRAISTFEATRTAPRLARTSLKIITSLDLRWFARAFPEMSLKLSHQRQACWVV